MIQLKSISEHRPKGILIDVPEEDIKSFLETGEFVLPIEEKLIINNKKSEKKPKIE